MKLVTICICLFLSAACWGADNIVTNPPHSEEPIYAMSLDSVSTNAYGKMSAIIRNKDTGKTVEVADGETLQISGADYLITRIDKNVVYARNSATLRNALIRPQGTLVFSRGEY